jgi:peroxiredoxin
MVGFKSQLSILLLTMLSPAALFNRCLAEDQPSKAMILSPGDTLTPIATLDIDGKIFESVRITSKGKFLLISFFTTYCKPCIAEFKDFRKLKSESEGKMEVLLVSVGPDSRDELINFRKEHEIGDFYIIRDRFGLIRSPFGVSDKVPVTFLINPSGLVCHAQLGAFPGGNAADILRPIITGGSVNAGP